MDKFPVLSLTIGLPVLVAFLILRMKNLESSIRGIALAGSAGSFLFCLEIIRRVTASGSYAEPWVISLFGDARPLFIADPLTAVPMTLFAALTIITIAAAPKRDLSPRMAAAILLIFASTLTVYAAENLVVLFVGWTINGLAYLRVGSRQTKLPVIALVTGIVCLGVGLGILGMAGAQAGISSPWNLTDLRTAGLTGQTLAFVFLMLAVFIHKGILPAHTWVIASFSRGPILPAGLLMNSHLGLFLMLHVVIPLLPHESVENFPFLSNIALVTAAYTAFIAISEKEPRRLLALITLSQASSIMASVQSMNMEGTTGALLQWMVVASATTGLISIYRAIEARVGEDLSTSKFLGLASSTPRLAIFFAIFGLALVGIPGTLGFFAEDLLLHGTLKSNPVIGILLPVATALNAIHIFRLFARLFLGSKGPSVSVPDALPRERWVLITCVLFLILGGLMPQWFVNLRISASDSTSAIESSMGADVD